MIPFVRTAFAMILSVSLVGTLSGCGGSTDGPALGSVSGTVTIDGAPASNVTVTFTPAEGGRASTGSTNSSGDYTLTYSPSESGAVVGNHTVTIRGTSLNFDESTPESERRVINTTEVPEEYEQETRTVEVKSGSNKIDLSYPKES